MAEKEKMTNTEASCMGGGFIAGVLVTITIFVIGWVINDLAYDMRDTPVWKCNIASHYAEYHGGLTDMLAEQMSDHHFTNFEFETLQRTYYAKVIINQQLGEK